MDPNEFQLSDMTNQFSVQMNVQDTWEKSARSFSLVINILQNSLNATPI